MTSDLLERISALERVRTSSTAFIEPLEGEEAEASFMPKVKLGGYADVGFFRVGGDGSGVRPDTGHLLFPELSDVPDSWVFAGDPLSTAINSRGDPADTGESRASTFDSVNSGGKPSFIVNALSLSLFADLGEDLVFEGLVDLVPRGRDASNPVGLFVGDFIDLKLAYARYQPFDALDLDLYAGKMDSVLGLEYRSQEGPDRTTVTPSLICRYTCGRPLGVKARLVLEEAVTLNVAITNGASMVELFPFYDEIDNNLFKTVSGRVSYRGWFGGSFEVGASGSIGAQDAQTNDAVMHWHYGFDLRVDYAGLELSAELVQGKAAGRSSRDQICDEAQCLEYIGYYALLGYRALNWLMPYARVDHRAASHRSGMSFAYVSNVTRITGGSRFELGERVVLKAEYTFNLEKKPVVIDDDILTTSAVIVF